MMPVLSVGVNPEMAHETMAGLNFVHSVAQAWESGKLFHIDLNDQMPGRYDQDLRFGSANPKTAFWLVKFLEDVGYDGPRHFDAHAYRTEDCAGVKDFASGCMRTYLILKEKACRWNADREIQRFSRRSLVARTGRQMRANSRRKAPQPRWRTTSIKTRSRESGCRTSGLISLRSTCFSAFARGLFQALSVLCGNGLSQMRLPPMNAGALIQRRFR